MKNPLFLLLLLFLTVAQLTAQHHPFTPLTTTKSLTESDDRRIRPRSAGYHQITEPQKLISQLKGLADPAPERDARLFYLPDPAGNHIPVVLSSFEMVHRTVREAYPELLTARGYDRDRPWVSVAVDWTPAGFHASVRNGEEGNWYVDPLLFQEQRYYQSYFSHDLPPEQRGTGHCQTPAKLEGVMPPTGLTLKSIGDCQLREYDLALACTGEYANFHGTNDDAVFGEMVTAINRVNQIFVQELALQLTLVNQADMAGNIDLVYNDATADPYTNSDVSMLITENQTTCDAVIGSGNYDIGHVFSTTGGGFAALQAVCNAARKAQGVSGLNVPQGEFFYVDLVAHELGHQFGSVHTFNSTVGNCSQREALLAFEPGSGSTVMAYAGICGSANIQSFSDDYFHGASISLIANYLESGGGNTCANVLSSSNTAPTVEAGSNYVIPANTPFVLTASASDPDGDFLTYCWEQGDLGPAVDNLPTGNEMTGPLFRSRPPTTSPERYFPRLTDLLNGTVDWEVLPKVARSMQFFVTVRDLHSDSSGNSYGCQVQDGMDISVVNTGQQYAVTSPNGGERWRGGSTETVTWNVAGTSGNGINCSEVDIVLSRNGGQTFTQVLSTVPNTGSATLTVPSTTATNARLMVRCNGNIFFDISDDNFRIEQTDFDFLISENSSTACGDDDTVTGYSFALESLQGYTGTVNLSTVGLPGGVTANFSVDPVSLGDGDAVTVTLNLSGVGALAAANYPFLVRATDGLITKERSFNLIVKVPLASPAQVSPADCDFLDPDAAVFAWDPVPNATSYGWRLYDNPAGAGFPLAADGLNNTVANFGDLLPVQDGDVRYWGIIAVDADCNPIEQSFSTLFKVQFGTAPVLPVEWLSFRVAPRGKTARLSWTVRQDADHAGFTVQRKKGQSGTWENLDWVNALPGEATVDYEYTDPNVREGFTHYYRLRQEDRDGQTNFSPIRSVRFADASSPGIFPNPAKDIAYLRGAVAYDRYEIYDARGRLMGDGVVRDGNSTISLLDRPRGIYQIRLSNPGGAVVVRLVKQ